MYWLKPVPFKELVRLQERPEEIGRVPHVRPGVHGPKKIGAAEQSLYHSN
jgi:hypothetical protein